MVIMLLIRSLADAASDLRYSFGPDFATVRVGWRFGRLKKFRRSGHVPEKAQMLGLEVTICRSEADTKQRRVSTTLRPVVMEFSEFFHLRWAVC
jgi:hypothetical protein